MPPFWMGTQMLGWLTAAALCGLGLSPLSVAIGGVVGPLIGWFLWRVVRGPRYRGEWP